MTIINPTPGQDAIDVSTSVTPVLIEGDISTYNASDSIAGNRLTTLAHTLNGAATRGRRRSTASARLGSRSRAT